MGFEEICSDAVAVVCPQNEKVSNPRILRIYFSIARGASLKNHLSKTQNIQSRPAVTWFRAPLFIHFCPSLWGDFASATCNEGPPPCHTSAR